MSLFVIGDLHLSESAEKPMDIFGERWRGYTQKIISNWNNNVSQNDVVIVAGDISWGMTIDEAAQDLFLLDSLNGNKIIMKGNHDYWWPTANKINNFIKANNISSINYLFNNAYMYNNVGIVGTRGWYYDKKNNPDNADYSLIINRECGRLKASINYLIRQYGDVEKIAFFHFPPVFGDFVCREIVDILKEHNITKCYFGHIHGVYDIPKITNYDGIDFEIISGDYLDFVPCKIIE